MLWSNRAEQLCGVEALNLYCSEAPRHDILQYIERISE
jgi:hypothetical protein